MDSSLAGFVLVALSFSVAFNLFLTLRLVAMVGSGKLPPPFSIAIGEVIPNFIGRIFLDGRRVASGDLGGQAAVFVFLSSNCQKCLTKIPELLQINHIMQPLGIPLWIVAVDSARGVARKLKGSQLLQQLLVLDQPTRRGLNPTEASPFYIFLDHRGIVQARNFVGDENWLLFVEQLHEEQSAISSLE